MASERIAQGVSKIAVFKAYLSTDHATEATGKTIAITISKNGATSFSNPAAGATNATEMAFGWYKVTLGTGDTDTQGPLGVRGTGTGIDDVAILFDVVSANNFGLASLPDLTTIATAGTAIPVGTVTTGASTTSVPTSALSINGSAATGVVADQFKNGFIFFAATTTTAGLRCCKRSISANTASNTPTLTVDTLPATPANGDTFQIM